MVGYGALRDPTLFGSNNEDLSGVIQRYIDLARQVSLLVFCLKGFVIIDLTFKIYFFVVVFFLA